MALLELRNLSVCIRQRKKSLEAVKGISFDVHAGEIAALAGESGSGKTLTGLSIPRLLPAAAEIGGGSVTFNSLSLDSCAEEDLRRIRGKEISMIFQEPRQSLNPLLRIGKQITETPRLHGEKNRAACRNAALEMLADMGFGEPEKIFRAYPHQLSPGMCQRVMIAIAAICKPKLLIADEPINSLDTATQEQVLILLKQMNRDFNTAILFITHDLSALRDLCSRVMIMYGGKIVEEGPVETIFTKPAHPYTRGLINAIPCKEQRGKALPGIGGNSPSIEEQIPGCPFASRCSYAQSRCYTTFPYATNLDSGHTVRCFLSGAGNV